MGKGKWFFLDSNPYNEKYDLVRYRIDYSTRSIVNTYKFPKGRVKMPNFWQYKWGESVATDGNHWKEGSR